MTSFYPKTQGPPGLAASNGHSYVNPIPNDARYKKGNRATLDMVCEAAYQGDYDALDKLLSSGDEDSIFNGDLNAHFTDLTALHMAAMAGQDRCVNLLLEANADPHMRAVTPSGKDPTTGATARSKAEAFGHKAVVKILQDAEKKTPPGWYEDDGIANNRKLYSEPSKKPKPKPAAAAEPPKKEEAPAAASSSKASKGGSGSKASAKAKAAPAPASTEPPLPIALLFPGQGSQYVNMLKGVKDVPEVRDMLDKAKGILGYDLLDLCLTGPEDKLAETRYCQPAMFVGGLAGVAKLRQQKPEAVSRCQCTAGLSLGEYTALCAAGVLSFEDGLRLVKLRGEAMQEAAQMSKQLMISVVGLERAKLDKLCDEAASQEGSGGVCKVANVLFPKGFSCAGTEKAIKNLEATAQKADGCLSAKILKTGGAFHTSLMQPAQEKLESALQEALPNMRPPTCAVYMNVTGEPMPAGSDPETIVGLLKRQLVNPVLWAPSVERMIKEGVQEFYECGPQKQVKAMMKRIDQKVWQKTTNVDV